MWLKIGLSVAELTVMSDKMHVLNKKRGILVVSYSNDYI